MSLPKYSVLKLKKALYGMKQAARCWWLHLRKILLTIGFVSGGEDPSTYTYNSDKGKAILWIHVDDGISINYSNAGFKFSQPELIEKVISLKKSNVTARSPLPANCNLVLNTSSEMDKEYLKRIGMILYISQGSRPDVAYGVNYLARFSMGTDTTHWDALEHLIAYLRYTRLSGILISGKDASTDLKCYVDANWGGEGDRSTQGFILFQGRNSISWQSKRQANVASSIAQAEYMAISFAAKECLWMSNLFRDITGELIPQILSDNKTAIGISTDSMNRKQTRHLWRDFNLTNE
ncbi:hypothetical protein O181_029525 [Austropuccinia psidii MF-1]|uniref:Reverse transcriptase Ty1/copia-type domain-containing protein n=1 Tax=Austropuccinia psidii MF-1 TaxID=1389203 RepID=A0A9Q3CUL2_9BASI|nr:hypothetical protein [Austropuccinia psidii MF-1]